MFYLISIINQIINSLVKIFLEIFIFDKKIRRILKGNWAKFYIKPYVNKTYCTLSEDDNNLCKSKRVIWQYWECEDNKTPPIVKACMNSVEQNKGDWERIVITPDNMSKYVKIPDIFLKLKNKGIIKTAFFSDILRTCLLLQNGGIWIDATVLLTEKLPDYISELDFFVFKNNLSVDLDGLNMASYFIVAKKNNFILEQTLRALTFYWEKNNFLVNYFLFLHTFTLVTQKNQINKNYFKQIPFFSFIPVQMFQDELLNEYSHERWEEIKRISGIHKLSYKKNVLARKKEFITQGTFYEFILKEYKGV